MAKMGTFMKPKVASTKERVSTHSRADGPLNFAQQAAEAHGGISLGGKGEPLHKHRCQIGTSC